MSRRWPISAILALLSCILVSPRAHAAWPHDPFNGNVPVCTANGEQTAPVAASDGAGGVIIAWVDTRNGNSDIFAQRVDALGSPVWTPTSGVVVCNFGGEQLSPVIVADGFGGAIVTWVDTRNGNSDIFAQRIDAVSGSPVWTPDGVIVCNFGGEQLTPAIVTDGASGAVVTWSDQRLGNFDIRAQRLNASGAAQWTGNGVALCAATGDQITPTIASDGANGAIVAWSDSRGASIDVYAQRVNAVGAPQWTPADGVALELQPNTQHLPNIVADGGGGAIVSWLDSRAVPANYAFYAQKVSGAGGVQWTPDVALSTAAAGNTRRSALSSDGAGGAILSFEQGLDILAQRVNAGGGVQWTVGGVTLTGAGTQNSPVSIPDGLGGNIVAWVDQSGPAVGVGAQRISGASVLQWAAGGVALTSAAGAQVTPTIVSDGASGAIAAWADLRSGTSNDIYAQRIERFGKLGTAEPVVESVQDVPNDQGGFVRLAFNASYLDLENDPDLAAYDVYRSIPPNTAQQQIARGESRRLRLGDVPVEGQRGTLFTVLGTQVLAWEFMSTVVPRHFIATYGSTQPTTGDEIVGSNPLTYFMVVGRDGSGSKYWLSAPGSGSSVDNLAPATPSPFIGNYSMGATHLHWNPTIEADLAHYRLYRGTSSGFVPGPGNLIATPPDTGYADAGPAGGYYKLSAVDVHGNESGFVLLDPQHTADAPSAIPVELAFGRMVPNPASTRTTVHLALPRETRVTLAIHDLAGRRVRTLFSGIMPAGERDMTWDLCNSAGVMVADGVYFATLGVEGRTIVRRLSVMK